MDFTNQLAKQIAPSIQASPYDMPEVQPSTKYIAPKNTDGIINSAISPQGSTASPSKLEQLQSYASQFNQGRLPTLEEQAQMNAMQKDFEASPEYANMRSQMGNSMQSGMLGGLQQSNGIIGTNMPYVPKEVKMEDVARPSIGGGGGATSWQVDPSTMTVEGRLGKLIDPNSQLMQQAQTQAAQASAARGLSNSSMAVTAGQDAMYRTAVPIANADAQMYGKAASDNAANATSMNNAATAAAAQMYGADKSAASSKYAADLNRETSLMLNDKNITSAEKIANLDNLTKTTLSNNSIASAEKMNALDNSVRTLLNNATLSSTEKIAGMNNANQLMMSNNQLSMQEKLTGLNNANQLLISTNSLTSQEKIAGLQANTSLAVAQMNKDAALSNSAAQIASSQAIASAQMETTRLTTQYQALGQASSSAGSIMVGINSQVASVLADPKLDGAAKAIAIKNINTQGANALNVIGGLASSLDLGVYIAPLKTDYTAADFENKTTVAKPVDNGVGGP